MNVLEETLNAKKVINSIRLYTLWALLHSINVLLINFLSADDFTAKYMRSLALVNNKGKVFWPPPTKFRSTCQVDVAYFPFDDQTCMLKLGSWLHDGFSVSNYLNNIKILICEKCIPMITKSMKS